MALVVRCPTCRGASQVGQSARGLTVQCPLCSDTFVAVPEAQLVTSRDYHPEPTQPVTTSTRVDPEKASRRERKKQRAPKEVDHDPHRHPIGGLPASVLIGFALLPFAIPMCWAIAPMVLGQPPILSLAVPLAIAVSASILSLSVIYTIDWSPALRVKGVLMLIGLAFFASVSLYFLKKEMVDWLQSHFSGHAWVPYVSKDASYKVLMPGIPRQGGDQDQPIPDMTLDCHKLTHSDAMGTYVYSVASGKTKADEKNRETGTEEWLKNAAAEIVKKSKGQFDPNIPLQAINAPPQQKGTGLQFGISLQKDKIQIVQLYVIDARIYYLAVLGDGINLNDEPVERFFKSFEILAKKK